MKDLNTLAQEIHRNNHRWWHDLKTGKPIRRNQGELLMLVITELAEAVEGIRKNLYDDKLSLRLMEEVEMADALIRLLDFAGGFNLWLEDMPPETMILVKPNKSENIIGICGEICDIYNMTLFDSDGRIVSLKVSLAIRRIRAYCHKYNLDLEGAVAEKLEYNKTREDHKVEARLAAGGKKF